MNVTLAPARLSAPACDHIRPELDVSLLATRLVREVNAVELYRALGGGLRMNY